MHVFNWLNDLYSCLSSIMIYMYKFTHPHIKSIHLLNIQMTKPNQVWLGRCQYAGFASQGYKLD